MQKKSLTKIGRPIIIAAGLILVAILLAKFAPARWQHLVIMWSFWTILGIGFQILLKVGEFSLGQAAFLAIGGYCSAVLTLKLHVPVWGGMLLGGALAAIAAALVGSVVLRLRGLYFCIITLAFAESMRLIPHELRYLGGAEGLWGLADPSNIGPISFAGKEGWIYLSFLLLAITALTFWRLNKSRMMRLYSAIGAAPELAHSLGINLMKYRVQVFVAGAFFTGLTGAVMAHYTGALGPGSYTLWYSLLAQLVAIVGGTPYIVTGPLAGAFVLTVADDYLGAVPGLRTLLYGVLLLLVVFFLPDGLLSLPKRLRLGAKARREALLKRLRLDSKVK